MSVKKIRECLLTLKQDMLVSPQIEKMADDGLATLDRLTRLAIEAYRGDVTHRLSATDSGVELAMLLEEIAMDGR